MRQLLLVPRTLRSGISLMGMAVLVVGCASHSLVPKEQAAAIQNRERALATHSGTIQEAIRQSGSLGALAFLDARDGHLVVLPGDSPADAWARYAPSAPSGPPGPVSMPTVVDFVYRPDVPKAPETVTSSSLQQQEELRTKLAALDAELGSTAGGAPHEARRARRRARQALRFGRGDAEGDTDVDCHGEAGHAKDIGLTGRRPGDGA